MGFCIDGYVLCVESYFKREYEMKGSFCNKAYQRKKIPYKFNIQLHIKIINLKKYKTCM